MRGARQCCSCTVGKPTWEEEEEEEAEEEEEEEEEREGGGGWGRLHRCTFQDT